MVGIGFLAGIILNTVGSQPGAIPWSDPVIWTSALMFAWLAAAAVFNALYRPARRGRKVAYLTVASFVFLVVALAVFFLVDTQHGTKNRRPPAARLESPSRAVAAVELSRLAHQNQTGDRR
jgi:hypothetical protein